MAKARTNTNPADPRRELTLDQVIGHDSDRRFLRRAWQSGRLPQVLLISGPAGIGKSTLAYALAREVVAEGGDPATHPRAVKVGRGVHPDVLEVTNTGSPSAQILVKAIRNEERKPEDPVPVEDFVSRMPVESPRRIVIIEPADRLNESAANGLLKTLEEPPSRMLAILIATEPGRLLPTIRSRATPIALEPVPGPELEAWLREKAKLPADRARLIASLSEGRPGYALGLAKAHMLDQRGEILKELRLLAEHGFAVVFRVADRLAALGKDPAETFTAAMLLLRDALVIQLCGEGILNEDLIEPLGELAQKAGAGGLLAAAERLEAAAEEVPYFYGAQARAHFIECVTTDVGRHLRE